MKTLTTLKRRPVQTTLLALVICLVAVPADAFANSQIYSKTLKSTAWIISKTDKGTSSGSGVLIDRDRKLVMTNYHVVGDQREVTIFFAVMNDNGRPVAERKYYLDKIDTLGLKSRVVAIDRRRDLAIVEIPSVPEGVIAIEVADKGVLPGDAVHSLGNPGSTDVLWAYTSGSVRAVYKKQFRTEVGEHNFTVVETTAPINSGDSGGPVVNEEGKLIAVSQAMSPKARLVTYCVDLTEITGFIAEDWKPAPRPVSELLQKTELAYEQHKAGPYSVEMTASIKKQKVFVSNVTEYYGKAEVRKVWSLGLTSKQPFSAEIALKLLQQNARTKMGAWTIEKNAQGQYLLIFVAKVDATASYDALKSAMEYVAKVAETMSRTQTNDATVAQSSADTSSWLSGFNTQGK